METDRCQFRRGWNIIEPVLCRHSAAAIVSRFDEQGPANGLSAMRWRRDQPTGVCLVCGYRRATEPSSEMRHKRPLSPARSGSISEGETQQESGGGLKQELSQRLNAIKQKRLSSSPDDTSASPRFKAAGGREYTAGKAAGEDAAARPRTPSPPRRNRSSCSVPRRSRTRRIVRMKFAG